MIRISHIRRKEGSDFESTLNICITLRNLSSKVVSVKVRKRRSHWRVLERNAIQKSVSHSRVMYSISGLAFLSEISLNPKSTKYFNQAKMSSWLRVVK